MINQCCMKQWPNAHAVFMSYIILNCSPVILYIPNGIVAKRKSFKFVNYVAEKAEFLKEVEKEWKNDVDGCQMFKVVKKLRNLKQAMKRLNWQNGYLFEKRNRVDTICDENGRIFEGKEVPKQFVNHFLKFLGINMLVLDIEDMTNMFVKRNSNNDALFMIMKISDKEVKETLFDINNNKAMEAPVEPLLKPKP
ncbi:hypothetical protein Tco_0660036 [Tanacetum coccineum]